MEEKVQQIETLTPRQKEILRLVAKHLQAKEIARVLNISQTTVKTHMERARIRLGVATSRDAAKLLLISEVKRPVLLEDGLPSGRTDDNGAAVTSSPHEHAISSKQPLPDHQLERSGVSLEAARSPREAPYDPRQPAHAASPEPDIRFGKGSVSYGRGDSVADGRQGVFIRRLGTLNGFQWLGLIFLIAVLLPLVAGGLMGSVLVLLEGINNLKSHAG